MSNCEERSDNARTSYLCSKFEVRQYIQTQCRRCFRRYSFLIRRRFAPPLLGRRFGNVIFFTPMLVANVVHIMETKKGDEGERAGRVLVDVTRHAENTLGTWS